MNRIPITLYIATNNPEGANAILAKYNIRPHRTTEGLHKALNYILEKRGEKALIDFTEYHPDRDLIVDLCGNSSFSGLQESSNACGCSSNCGGCERNSSCEGSKACAQCSLKKYSGADGSKPVEAKSDTMPMLIVAGFVLIGALIIYKN